MSEPRVTRGVERIAYSGGAGISVGAVNVRRNRSESATRTQIQRILDNYYGGSPENADERLRRAAMRTWNALDATGRLAEPYGFSSRAELVGRASPSALRRRLNRR